MYHTQDLPVTKIPITVTVVLACQTSSVQLLYCAPVVLLSYRESCLDVLALLKRLCTGQNVHTFV